MCTQMSSFCSVSNLITCFLSHLAERPPAAPARCLRYQPLFWNTKTQPCRNAQAVLPSRMCAAAPPARSPPPTHGPARPLASPALSSWGLVPPGRSWQPQMGALGAREKVGCAGVGAGGSSNGKATSAALALAGMELLALQKHRGLSPLLFLV